MNLKGILEVAGRTDTGLVRTRNEDSIRQDLQLGTVVLADGMGGYKGGEVASDIAVTTILESLRTHLAPLKPGEADAKTGYSRESSVTREAILEANRAIYQSGQSQPQYQGMGTTLVMGVFYDNRITVAHIGDSRLYRLHDNNLELMTVDHTLMQELTDRGFYTREAAQASLNKNLVTRALGIEPSVAVDINESMVLPGDTYLLCSDGLNDMITDTDIAGILRQDGNGLARQADALISLANKNGGKDNVSVMLARPGKAFPARQHWTGKLRGWLNA